MGKDVTNDIISQAQEFELRYDAYKVRLHEQRMKYRELNYFTTQQLLFLRKELAAIKRKANVDFPNFQVFALLEKIVPGISPSTLKGVLIEAGVIQESEQFEGGVSDQPPLPGNHLANNHQAADEQVQIEEKFELLLKSVEKLNYSEADRLALAALVDNWQNSEADLVIWCVQNNTNDDLIDDLCDQAKKNPLFRVIVKEVAGLESSESSEDSEEEDIRYLLYLGQPITSYTHESQIARSHTSYFLISFQKYLRYFFGILEVWKYIQFVRCENQSLQIFVLLHTFWQHKTN